MRGEGQPPTVFGVKMAVDEFIQSSLAGPRQGRGGGGGGGGDSGAERGGVGQGEGLHVGFALGSWGYSNGPFQGRFSCNFGIHKPL
jgi:hypothetical protein